MKKLILASAFLLSAAVPAFADVKPSTVAPSTPLPVAIFGKLPAIEDPVISPDGKVMAAKMRARGEQFLAILPLDVPNPVPKLIAKDGDFDKLADVRATDWSWIDGENLLVWVTARENFEGESYDAVRVIGYNYKTGKRTLLGWDGAMIQAGNVLWTSRDGPPTLLLSRLAAGRGTERLANPEVVKVDVATGKQEIVLRPHGMYPRSPGKCHNRPRGRQGR